MLRHQGVRLVRGHAFGADEEAEQADHRATAAAVAVHVHAVPGVDVLLSEIDRGTQVALRRRGEVRRRRIQVVHACVGRRLGHAAGDLRLPGLVERHDGTDAQAVQLGQVRSGSRHCAEVEVRALHMVHMHVACMCMCMHMHMHMCKCACSAHAVHGAAHRHITAAAQLTSILVNPQPFFFFVARMSRAKQVLNGTGAQPQSGTEMSHRRSTSSDTPPATAAAMTPDETMPTARRGGEPPEPPPQKDR